jgi:hypothetical protein
LLGKTPFHKCINNSEYFKHINIGIKVLRGRKYYKEVILWQCGGIKTLLTIKSKMGLSRGIRAPLTIKSKMGLSKGIRALLTIKSKIGFSKGIKTLLTTKSKIGLSKDIA